ncbi:MAG: DUF47 family protein [Magnetococcus sp. DMHC-6]
MNKLRLLGNTKEVENQFEQYLDILSQGGIAFSQGITHYLEKGTKHVDFTNKVALLIDLEHKNDDLRRAIEQQLYMLSLIPDFRGDVLSLLEDLDFLLNLMTENMDAMAVEAPEFPKEMHGDVRQMAIEVANSVESVVMTTRSFLRDINAVRDHMHKVMYYEKEADKKAKKIRIDIFSSALPLAEKSQLRRFIDKIDDIADEAENVADLLAIYTIKRLD